MATVLADDLQVCTDCIMMIANGDASGIEREEDVHAVEEGMRRLSAEGGYPCAGDSERDRGFSWWPCHCCRRPLGGDRFHCVLLGA